MSDEIVPEESAGGGEGVFEETLRPRRFSEFIGQAPIKENLLIALEASRKRGDVLDHLLLYGAPGLGKTTLANVIAKESGRQIRLTSGPAIERSGDLVAILTNLEEGDILFIDEIHRLSKAVEEVLYPAMEEYAVDIVIGKGPSARSIRLEVPRFTLIGATTKAAMIAAPLRDRFGHVHRLEYYSEDDLTSIIKRSASILQSTLDPAAGAELARRSRRTPRIANRLLKRVRDLAEVSGVKTITPQTVAAALEKLGIDERGLEPTDRSILETIAHRFAGGPAGLESIAAASREDAETIETLYEPYLLEIGFIERTPRGRKLTEAGYHYLGLKSSQDKLL